MRLLAFALLTLACQAVLQPQRPVIRSTVTYVSTDVVVRDERGQFVADLREADFEVLEDGVRQRIAGFTLTHGGRVIADTPPAGLAGQGLLLPPLRPAGDASGRVFLILVDDLHLAFPDTGRLRDLLKRISAELIHEGDLFGVVSTGPSSIALDLTYDRGRLDEVIRKVSGAALRPDEIMSSPAGAQGPPEVRYRAHVAFSTAYDIFKKFEQMHTRRKACVYVSNGYDFDPFSQARVAPDARDVPDTNPFAKTGNEFAAADLAAELAELTREANRATTTIYTIDPRGLVAGPAINQTTIDPRVWQDHVRETQNSLRTLAELTGGFAAIDTNDFDRALKRIDAETSDYYVIGYYSTNPDPLKKRRTIEIKVTSTPTRRADAYRLSYRTSYTLRPQ